MSILLARIASAHRDAANAYTASLLHFDESNGSMVFVDEFGPAWSIPNGAPSISTTKSKFGGSSGHFNSSADSITATSSKFQLSGDATIECFYNADSLTADRGLFFFGAGNQDSNRIQLYVKSNGSVAFYGQLAGVDIFWPITAASVITTGVWNHIAAEILGNVASIYVGGALKASVTFSGRPAVSSVAFIGIARTGATSRSAFGYIDEARITNGECRYGGAFTPPSAPFSPLGSAMSTTPTVSVSDTSARISFRSIRASS